MKKKKKKQIKKWVLASFIFFFGGVIFLFLAKADNFKGSALIRGVFLIVYGFSVIVAGIFPNSEFAKRMTTPSKRR